MKQDHDDIPGRSGSYDPHPGLQGLSPPSRTARRSGFRTPGGVHRTPKAGDGAPAKR